MTLTISSGPPAGPPLDDEGADGNTVIFWKVRCINRKTKLFFDRMLALSTSELPEADRHTILPLVATIPADRRIVHYRDRFKPVEANELATLDQHLTSFSAVTLDDYFEDENEQPLTMVGVFEALSGQANPIILGNVPSVLRLGPACVQQKDKWTVAKANDIAHFLRIVETIAASEWHRSPLSIEYRVPAGAAGQQPDAKQLLDWKHPTAKATREVLLPIRQLYSSDDVFNFACNAYLQHVADEGKRFWVKDRKSAFNNTRSGEPHFFKIENYTTQEILDLLIYGCGEVHRQSNDNTEERFKDALKKYGTPHVFMAFGFASMDLLRYAFETYHVVKQDFDHWIAKEGIAGPDRVGLDELHGKGEHDGPN